MISKCKAILFLALIGGLFLPKSYAQEASRSFCGTKEGKVEWLTKYQANLSGYLKTAEILYVPITIHVVGSDAGTGYFSRRSILDAFCTLNEDFIPSDIQFYIEGDLNYIANSDYNDHDFGVGFNMMIDNNIQNTINCYIVDNPADACGYSYYNAGVALSESCIDPGDHTWAHEMGHNLSLAHTFFGWEGESIPAQGIEAPTTIDGQAVEKLDGSNCAFAADGFCDTPPDYLSYIWQCNSDNESTVLQTDPNGESFKSDATLLMSYSSDNCAARFSDEQIQAMRNNLYGPREYLLYNQTPQGPVQETTLISPINAALTGNPAAGIDLEWEAVANAAYYIVELNPFPFFGTVLYSFMVTEPYLTVYGLSGEHEYFWRVRPYNNYSSCAPFTTKERFLTDVSITGLADFEWDNSFSIFPNPLSTANTVTISYHLKVAAHLNINVLDATGKLVYQQNIAGSIGDNEQKIKLGTLPNGLYLFNLTSNEGQLTRKIIIKE